MLQSYNGWPASKDPAEIGIKSYAVPGTNRKLRCAEAVAPLLVGFAHGMGGNGSSTWQ